MRRFGLAFALLAVASAAAAEDGPWQSMSGKDISAILTGRIVDYGGDTWQDFRASGRTLYHAGRPSWGYWAVRGDQYCSSWPPSDLWVCYDMERRGPSNLRWIGQGGDTIAATLRPPDG